jgi:transcriptional regulator with XRE-family HTH domain
MSALQMRTVLASNLRQALAKKGISIEVLAEEAGVSRSQLYDVLSEKKAATVDWLDKVGSALGVAPWQLLKEKRARA